MRQSHQKSRSRGRNRKPQNPMSRNFESNGPDVKIRGNAAHIADKYSSLARDALSNGDTVMAENYYQHAEHYNRIIAAAQLQRAEESSAANGRGPQPEVTENGFDASSENEPAREETAVTVKAEDGSAKESPDEPRERKNGRNRRTKRAAPDSNDGVASADQVDVSESEVPAVEPEIISDDAASLPQSITGSLQVEEG